MLARKCDFCSAFYDYYRGKGSNAEDANAIKFIDKEPRDSYSDRAIYDVCPDCLNKILELGESLKNGNSEKGDTEAPADEILPPVSEMRKYIAKYCASKTYCSECAVHNLPGHVLNYCYSSKNTTKEDVIQHYLAIKREEKTQ